MIKYNQKYKKYVGFINTALLNKNIDNEDHEWEENAPLRDFIYSNSSLTLTNSVSLHIDSSELILLIKINEKLPSNDNILNAIIKEIQDNVENYPSFDTVNIIWILSSIDIKIKVRHICNSIVNHIKTALPNFLKVLSTYYLDIDICTHEIKLNNTKRPKMILLPPLEPNVHIQEISNNIQKQYPHDLKGYMLTANLFDIVEIYKQVGDTLFKDNVRFGIADQLGVDKAIKDSLKNAPNYFWFRNNGITMLIEEPDTILNSACEIVLKQKNEEKIRFSVINGAQTITAAAEYFYTLQIQINESESKDKVKAAKLKEEFENAKNAKVVLRMIQIQGKNIPEEARKISVALNRQKPIKMEDIAFTNNFVEKMNSFLDFNQKNYSLAKRSEISYSPNEYSLIDFARARKACSGAPGEARNKDAAALLKISEKSSQNDQRFTDTAIFVEEWYSSKDDKSNQKIFNKFYSPILFAMKVANIYENDYKNLLSHNSYYDTVIKNGKWYFVSFLVFALNGNDADYSSFDFSMDHIKREEIISLIEEFAKFYCELFEESTPKINSNTFKKSEQYNKIKNSDYKRSKFYMLLSQTFKLSNSVSQQAIVNKRNPPTKVSTVKLSFNPKSQNVNNAADAFSYTVSECLKYAYKRKIKLDSFLMDCPYISTSKRDTGYFRSNDSITINNKQFYIGKSHSFDTKVSHINKLCDYLDLAANSICWLYESNVVYKNS